MSNSEAATLPRRRYSLSAGEARPQGLGSAKAIAPSVCAGKLKILADSTRLAILETLTTGPKHVGEINALLDLEQSLLSHHLKVLRNAGLIRSKRDGKAMLYSLDTCVERTKTGTAIDLGCCQLSFDRVFLSLEV